MFKKMLIANRGEIAVRVMRTCREMGIATVGLYEAADRNSLHVRMADECVLVGPGGFDDPHEVAALGIACGADAIHPGYGFLAENEEFIRMCDQAGLAFIGPPAEVVELVSNKVMALRKAEAAGFRVIEHSSRCFDELEYDALQREAELIGYPLFVKSCRGGRGRGQRLVRNSRRLREMVVRAQWEARTIYRDRSIFLEKGYMPAHQINVQVLGDREGRLMVFGEREGSLLYGNQKLFEESPSPAIDAALRQALLETSVELARLFHLQNAASIEYLLDENQEFYFVEIKPRIQMEHPLTEMTARIDLVREQIRLAAGETLQDLQPPVQHGWAVQCRIAAENPWKNFLPCPGEIESVRLPSGQDVRVDTYIQAGSLVPADYDPLIGKLVVWGPTREACLRRASLAVDEFKVSGVPTNLPVIQNILKETHIMAGQYNTDFRIRALVQGNGHDLPCDYSSEGDAGGRDQTHLRDLAVAAAIYYVKRTQAASPTVPDRLRTGWHLKSRQLP